MKQINKLLLESPKSLFLPLKTLVLYTQVCRFLKAQTGRLCSGILHCDWVHTEAVVTFDLKQPLATLQFHTLSWNILRGGSSQKKPLRASRTFFFFFLLLISLQRRLCAACRMWTAVFHRLCNGNVTSRPDSLNNLRDLKPVSSFCRGGFSFQPGCKFSESNMSQNPKRNQKNPGTVEKMQSTNQLRREICLAASCCLRLWVAVWRHVKLFFTQGQWFPFLLLLFFFFCFHWQENSLLQMSVRVSCQSGVKKKRWKHKRVTGEAGSSIWNR